MTTPHENLANAIILQAVKDYREALRDLSVNPDYPPALHTALEVEQFFHSDWFSELTDLNGTAIVKKLKKECSTK
jgi:hypothetical protein